MVISKGKKRGAQKVILYAPEGWGKSTAASMMPDPVFLDTEDSTIALDVKRIEADYSDWDTLLKTVDEVLNESPRACKTLVIDTVDWAEQSCINKLNAEHKTKNILTLDYGKGSQFVHAEFCRLLVRLDKLVDKGINVVLLAHAVMRKVELPEEMGQFDKWELKLQSKQVKAQLKEWAYAVLFGNYRTLVVKDEKTRSNKARGGKRVIYATHTPTWDAKNRHNMPDMMDLDYDKLNGYLFGDAQEAPAPETKAEELAPEPAKVEEKPKEPIKKERFGPMEIKARAESTQKLKIIPELKEIMLEHNVANWDVEAAVGNLKGAPYGSDTSIEDYSEDFQRKLVKSFAGMYKKIQKAWDTDEIPFD